MNNKTLLLPLFVLMCCPLAQGQIITTVAGTGIAGYTGDGTAATTAKIDGPENVAADHSGNFYIADYNANVVRKVSAAGIISTIAGTGTGSYTGDGGLATAATLWRPYAIAVGIDGSIYIADMLNNRIRKINTAGYISTFAGNGSSGYGGDGGPATLASLSTPYGVATDLAGNVYIADTHNSVIRKVDTSGVITTIAGNTTPGFSGDGGAATAAQLHYPSDVVVDRSGRIFIADTYNYRLREVDLTGVISTIAGDGTSSSGPDGVPATASSFQRTSGIAVDTFGNVYTADALDSRVRKVNTAGIITTVAGIAATFGYSGDGGDPVLAKLESPSGVAVGTSGSLYIADYSNSRVRKITFGIDKVTGDSVLCVGSTLTLADSTTSGTWYSDNAGIASVGSSSGIVSGVTPGVTTIVYTTGISSAIRTVTVMALPSAGIISGVDSVCLGKTIALTDTTAGGTWHSTNSAIATITGTGTAAGLNPGMDTILYVATNACGSDTAKFIIKVPVHSACYELVGTIKAQEENISLMPNPNNGSFTLSGAWSRAGNESVFVSVTNMVGQSVYSKVLKAANGSISGRIELGNSVPRGVYIVTLQAAAERKLFRMVVE